MVSFTSNSEMFPRLKLLLQIWLVALLVVLCFVVFVTFSTFSWFYDPTSIEKRIKVVQELSVVRRPNPRIIILGTSRAAFGLVPATIERVLQQPALSTANWSYPGFRVEAFEHLAAINKEKIARAELVVLGIDQDFALELHNPAALPQADPYIITRNWALETDQAIRRHVSSIVPVAKKMAWFLRESGGRLGLVPLFRLNWAFLPSGYWDSGAGNRKLSEQNARREADVIAQSYFKDKIVSMTEVARWETFLRSLVSVNPKIALVYLPTAPTFVIAGQPYAEKIRKNLENFEHLAKTHGAKLIDITAAECELGDDMYADPIHVNREGSHRLSQCFARRLQREPTNQK